MDAALKAAPPRNLIQLSKLVQLANLYPCHADETFPALRLDPICPISVRFLGHCPAKRKPAGLTMVNDMSAPDPRTLLEDLLAKTRRAGADAADAVFVEGISLALSQRLGQPELLERSEANDLGLRVFVGKKQAIVSSTDIRPAHLEALVERAIAMARNVPDDPYCGLADPVMLTRTHPALDIFDPTEPTGEDLIGQARIAEEAALGVEGVTNSEGAEASWSQSEVHLAATNGFSDSYRISRRSLAVSVLAGNGTKMERDYDFTSAVFADDLIAPDAVGRNAGERAVRRLNPRRVSSQRVPVVFEPRVSRSLLNHLASAINGVAIARGTSFLKDRLGEQIFPSSITVVDNPLLPRGPRSRPFDAEGLAVTRRNIIEDGRLTTWLLDLRSGRQLGMLSTGHATRGPSSTPSPSPWNLSIVPGTRTPQEVIAEIDSGFFVTELMGMGVNGVTGDYSRGAAGYWIENGEIAYPVSELTIAGNLKEMFMHIEPASDLVVRYGVDAPTLRIDEMTVAGS